MLLSVIIIIIYYFENILIIDRITIGEYIDNLQYVRQREGTLIASFEEHMIHHLSLELSNNCKWHFMRVYQKRNPKTVSIRIGRDLGIMFVFTFRK